MSPTAIRRGARLVLGIAGVLAATACGRSSSPKPGGNRGIAEGTFRVTIQNGQDGNTALRIRGGRVHSADLSIDCGLGENGEALTACSREVPLGSTVVLHATAYGNDTSLEPPRPYVFLGWAGDCRGVGECTLKGDADQYVVALFSAERGPAAVTITPANAAVDECRSVAFQATVSGTSNGAVTWTVQEGSAGGTIGSDGVYTAPAAAGTYHVVATSQATPTASAATAVTVAERVLGVSVSPAIVAVQPGATTVLTATVTTTCGTFSSTKTLTAPN